MVLLPAIRGVLVGGERVVKRRFNSIVLFSLSFCAAWGLRFLLDLYFYFTFSPVFHAAAARPFIEARARGGAGRGGAAGVEPPLEVTFPLLEGSEFSDSSGFVAVLARLLSSFPPPAFPLALPLAATLTAVGTPYTTGAAPIRLGSLQALLARATDAATQRVASLVASSVLLVAPLFLFSSSPPPPPPSSSSPSPKGSHSPSSAAANLSMSLSVTSHRVATAEGHPEASQRRVPPSSGAGAADEEAEKEEASAAGLPLPPPAPLAPPCRSAPDEHPISTAPHLVEGLGGGGGRGR